MKLLFGLSLLMASYSTAGFAAGDEPEFLLSQGSMGGYIGVVAQTLSWEHADATLIGFQSGWSLHERLSLGVEVLTLANQIESEAEFAKEMNVTLYGMHGETRLYSWRFLTGALTFGVGSGTAGYRLEPDAQSEETLSYHEGGLQYTSAGLNVLVHLNANADLGLGYGVLSVKDANLPGFNSSDLKSSLGAITLRKKF